MHVPAKHLLSTHFVGRNCRTDHNAHSAEEEAGLAACILKQGMILKFYLHCSSFTIAPVRYKKKKKTSAATIYLVAAILVLGRKQTADPHQERLAGPLDIQPLKWLTT